MAVIIPNDYLWFPPINECDEDGLVALTEDFSFDRIILGYQSGLFPWFQQDGYFHWFAPNPRCILIPSELKISKSMKQFMLKNTLQFTINYCFEEVMMQCANSARKPVFMNGQLYPNDSTWINMNYVDAYTHLHEMGYAISAEAWQDGKLVGGLYGVLLGKVLFGESMFAHVSNASKFAFISLVQYLQNKIDLQLIDCQQPSPHLISLGAKTISSKEFEKLLKENI
jgi:leucyl/phenylalanyl-tRNA---protein transferase